MSSRQKPSRIGRRDLLRWTAVAGLVAGLGLLLRRRNPAAEAVCTGERRCRHCPRADDCVQPEAMSWRAVRKDA